jgi:hypothetical protein
VTSDDHVTLLVMKATNNIFSKSNTPCTTAPITSGNISDTRYVIRKPFRTPHTTPDLIRLRPFNIVAETRHVAETRIVAETILVAALLWLTHKFRSAHDSASDFN